jgi:SAM-dependent methyltransferase
MTHAMRYEFGKNWAEFIEHSLSAERVETSRKQLLEVLKLPDLRGRSFLDIGCGSGLHSLAAHYAGAERVTSFDYDSGSVATTRLLHQHAGAPSTWRIMEGSVLDRPFMAALEPADIVYSWGVLHHTGAMWEAIRQAAGRTRADGVLFIALYTTDVFIRSSPRFWLAVKRRYNRAGPLVRWGMEWTYALRALIGPALVRGRNPVEAIRVHQAKRGMSFWTDIKDWLGGWPMEFGGLAETKRFAARDLGLELLNISAGEANTEYVFRRRGARNYFDDVLATRPEHLLAPPFASAGGKAWIATLPAEAGSGDSLAAPRSSRLMVYEDGTPSGFGHAPHAHISAHGHTRYSHWNNRLIFSASDDSDPNGNGRRYSYRLDMLSF